MSALRIEARQNWVMASTQTGVLLIADITGYSQFLSSSELEHANQVLEALLGLLVDMTKPPLRIAGLEGDAVLSHVMGGVDLAGQTFAEIVEQTYVAFRRAIEQMVLNTSCTCNACANISTLDLKFFVHHGTFALQKVGDRTELVGSDVVFIHRLLKNQIRATTGIVAYAAHTTQAIRALGLDSPGFLAHRETFETIGETTLFVTDLHPVWEESRNRVIVELPSAGIVLDGAVTIPLAPEVVWDYLAKPDFRRLLLRAKRTDVTGRSDGRIGEGSAFKCYHGGGRETTQLIVAWQPFTRMMTRDQVTSAVTCLIEYVLDPVEGRTLLTVRGGAVAGPLVGRWVISHGLRLMKKRHEEDLRRFAEAIVADHESRVASLTARQSTSRCGRRWGGHG